MNPPNKSVIARARFSYKMALSVQCLSRLYEVYKGVYRLMERNNLARILTSFSPPAIRENKRLFIFPSINNLVSRRTGEIKLFFYKFCKKRNDKGDEYQVNDCHPSYHSIFVLF